MPFKSAWKLSVVQAKEADEIFSQVFGLIISTVSKKLKMDSWRSDIFGSTIYKIFAPKCQNFRVAHSARFVRSVRN